LRYYFAVLFVIYAFNVDNLIHFFKFVSYEKLRVGHCLYLTVVSLWQDQVVEILSRDGPRNVQWITSNIGLYVRFAIIRLPKFSTNQNCC